MNLSRVGSALLLCALLAMAARAAKPRYDLVIRHGRIVDGTGAVARDGDIAIDNDRIVLVGTVTNSGKTEIDADGLVVTPGFIDVHTHAEDILELPRAENFARMGVTTVVIGNCGSSVTNVGEFFHKVDKTKVAVNVATLIGHGTVREHAMGGRFDRPPSPEELKRMEADVERAMLDGALGLSTGLIYLPGTFAKTDEIVALARVAAQHHGIYASHMRSESAHIFEAIEELCQISREAGLPGHISHIKLSGRANWGQTDKVLALIERARAEGLKITQDQYAYTASSTSISTLVPKKYREGGRFAEYYGDPKTRAEMAEEMKSPRERGNSDYSYAVIADYKKNRALNGLNVAQAAKKLHGSDSLDAQVETILEIQKNGSATAVFHGMNETDVGRFMQHSNTMFASDSGVRKFKQGVPHPRGYGNNARILARYIRDQHLLPLEEAVRRMTSLPATTFGLKDRGFLREGCHADLAIFDPGTVLDNATFDDPHHYATGFAAVIVQGRVVVRRDKHTGAKPGQAVRRDQ